MDLFEEDKRLTLKPVRDLSATLVFGMMPGACTCIRCKESNGNQEGYAHLHTFEIGMRAFNRRFTHTAYSDIRGALSAAWEAYYKKPLPESGAIDLADVYHLLSDEAAPFLVPLLCASGVAKKTNDGVVLLPPA